MLDYYFYPGSSGVIGLYEITESANLGGGIVCAKTYSSSDGGINLGLEYFYGKFGVDSACVSGASIFNGSTFSGIALASLGMTTPGILATWTLVEPNDSSYVGDTISVQFTASSSSSGSPAYVPGPLPLLGLGVAFGFSRLLRRLVRLRSKTSEPS